MSSQPSISTQAQQAIRDIQRLRVRDLSEVCQSLGLPKSGVKAEIQRRIIEAIQAAAKHNDPARFQAVRDKINRKLSPPRRDQYHSPAPTASPASTSHAAAGMSHSFNFSHGYGGAGGNATSGGQLSSGPQFKPSPFYDIDSSLGTVHTCEVMATHRNSIVINLKASTFPGLQKCNSDPSYRVLLFSAGGATGIQDIAFPHACEIKVNKDDVKANMRGIKNKPGSTRPVDITPLLRLKPPSYNNTVEFIYALTNKPFYVVLYLCRKKTPTDLVQRVEQRPRISKASVISEISRKAHADPDIVATSTTLSLKCPLSGGRIKVPIRATSCKHNQCFDAISYLQLQEQAPLWVCPECSNPAAFDNLAVDEYVKDILVHTSPSVEAVTVEPNGQWRVQSSSADETKPQQKTCAAFANAIDEDEDDLSVISDPRGFGAGNSIGFKSSVTSATTPGLATPRDDVPKSSTPSASNKRPRAEVIDLTLDSDEEDSLPVSRPAAKRVNYGDYGSAGASY